MRGQRFGIEAAFTWGYAAEGWGFWAAQYDRGLTDEGRAALRAMLAQHEQEQKAGERHGEQALDAFQKNESPLRELTRMHEDLLS